MRRTHISRTDAPSGVIWRPRHAEIKYIGPFDPIARTAENARAIGDSSSESDRELVI